jgi:hypothetical protein
MGKERPSEVGGKDRMKKDDVCYGLEHWERLEMDPESVVERVLEDACDKVGEGFDALAARIEWPIRILVYKRRDIGGEACAESIAARAIEHALENLDEEYADPDGDYTKATDRIKDAARAFGRAVVADYVSWSCEPTGEVIEYTREQAEREERCLPNAESEVSELDRKAYHVATVASDIVWGGEHGWERDEVGEHDLARALRQYVRDLKKQNEGE